MNTRIDWAVSRINHWIKFYEAKFPQLGNLGLKYEFSYRLRTTAGIAYRYQRKISLNYNMLISEGDGFDATIAHEIAHIVTDVVYGGFNQHNARWQYVFGLSGHNVKRCHNYESSVRNRRYRLKFNCMSCNKSLSITPNLYTKMKNGQSRKCAACKCIINVNTISFEKVIDNV